jgi:CBS domain-containing protein
MAAPNSSSVVLDSVVQFLKDIPPFQFLPSDELTKLAGSMSLEYFPKGTVILSAGGKASDSLFVIKKGGVKLTLKTDDGMEVVLDMRSEGELFGLLSTMGGDITRLDVKAWEDALCYSVPGDGIRDIIARHPDVAGYLVRTSITRYIDRSLNEIRERTRLLADGERLLYSLGVGDVAKTAALTCYGEASIRAAAQVMAANKATAIFVKDETGKALGIITESDLAEKVVANEISSDSPATSIMSAPVISVDASERLFHALIEMLNHNVHHLLVTRDGMPNGVITYHDLLLLQGKSPLALLRHVGQQSTLDDLVAAQGRTYEIIPLLIREGAKASHVTRIVAELNDRVLTKILELAEKEIGKAPVPYCWIVLGSEGRREQTFKTDQDNGLIYTDVAEEEHPRVAAYFEKLVNYVSAALERCGYPPCPGGFMATNPRWRQPLSQWKAYFHEWITDAQQITSEDALIFFDMRAVAGDSGLCDEIWRRNRELLKEGHLCKSILAFITINHKPPLGFFHQFVVNRAGEHKNEFDLKLHGTGPIANAARLWCLDAGISETNTIDRLTALQQAGYGDAKLLTDLTESMEFLTALRLEHQLQLAQSDRRISNYVNPEKLSQLQRTLLKEAFEAIARAQDLVKSTFETWVWAQLR